MRKFRAYLQLMRFPALFTSMADVLLGFLLTHQTLEPVHTFLTLLGASSCLYLSGMVFNDFFDRHIDARERPHRPIPARLISPRSAAFLGGCLMVTGVLLAGLASSSSQRMALLLAGAVLLYDGVLKNTPLGPLIMGSCRFLNVMLGASAGYFVWVRPQLYAAGALGIYIAGVTWYARQEAGISRRWALFGAAAVMNLGLVGLAAFVAVWQGEAHWPGESEPNPTIVFVFLAAIAAMINFRVTKGIIQPSAGIVQRAVKTLLMSIILLDATLIFFKTGRIELALLTTGLMIPMTVLGRWLYIT